MQCYLIHMAKKTFKNIWVSLDSEEKQSLADELETTVPYLSQLAHGHRQPGRHMGNAIGDYYSSDKEKMFPGVFA